MKKITLLLLLILFFPSLGHSQSFTEGFEGQTFPPAGWTVFDNGVGTGESWNIIADPAFGHNSSQAAQVLRENIGQDNTSEDWLVTPLMNIMPNPQLRFFSRSQLLGNQGTLYQIRISSPNPTGGPNAPSTTYTIFKTYTELELSDFATTNYKEHRESLPAAFSGTNRYIAFVRIYTQPTSQTGGDKWLLDDVSMMTQCFDPTNLSVTDVASTTAVLGWEAPTGGASSYDVEWGTTGFTPGQNPIQGLGSGNPTTNSITATNLPVKSTCDFYVRSRCSSERVGEWEGPFIFYTNDFGTRCSDPKVVPALPYQVTNDDTAIYGDNMDIAQGPALLCGAVPSSDDYTEGNDVVYSYTANNDGFVNILMTPLKGITDSANSSIFVYEDCANIGVTCYAGMANAQATPREVVISVSAGHTYMIVISSSAATQTINYDLLIETVCEPKPTQLGVTNITLDSADLSWTSPEYSTWEVAVQPLGSKMPLGAGTAVDDNPHTYTGLTAGTQYQYWVRGECSPGSEIYTTWAGPYAFNTLSCDPADRCTHTIRMTDSANNGWNGAVMQVRQNGIVLGTFGSTYTSGAGPIDIPISLCKDIPFDIYWLTGGTKPEQCIVSVINSFGQTIYIKNAGVGSPGTIITPANLAAVNCTVPRCDIIPINLKAIPSTHTAQLKWDAPATTMWDIYLVPKGNPAPNPTETPTYPGVIANPFDVADLTADMCYDFYVRVHCASANPSDWSPARTFCTQPTCPKPKGLGVSAITTVSASLAWTPAIPTDNLWDILLVPSPTTALPGQLPPNIPSYPNQIFKEGVSSNDITVNGTQCLYNVTGLTPATIYFYYIRTKCAGNDDGSWAGPFAFNTVRCDPSTMCTYKFILTDTGGNGWQNGRMEVRQNGISAATIGAAILATGGPVTVNVQLCPDVPFDLYWSLAGIAPNEIGISIQNPSSDILYTKIAGEGKPLDVLFSSMGNCDPPSCPKPKALSVISTFATSAVLDWTESGSATKWEIYAVPTAGSVPPLNGSPVTGQDPWAGGPYYLVNAKPFTITGLSVNTSYTYYVRALCSDTNVSNWTITEPKAFMTKPLNDECADAVQIPVSPAKVCSQSVSGNTLGATGSLPLTSPVCSGTTDDDIWFTFVATAPTHIITLSNIAGGTQLLNHTVYEGADCGSLKQLYCSKTTMSIATELTIGQIYKIRVFTAGSKAGVTATFDICITTPPLLTNDECSQAKPAGVNNNAECMISTTGLLTGASASSNSNTCIGSADDDVWFSFVATGAIHYFDIKNVMGTTIDLNHAVYSGDCGSLEPLYCSTDINLHNHYSSLSSNYAGFEIGQSYYVRVWSNSSEKQDVTFDLCIGTSFPITTDTAKYTSKQLVEDVLFGTHCANITNVQTATGTAVGSVNGIGYFNSSLSNFKFKDGVVLTSGNALSVPGPNTSLLGEGNAQWLGDKDLQAILLQSGVTMQSINASKVEFDFVPLADKISFNFIFASEEYSAFQCGYSDGFAFILTPLEPEPGTPINLAVLPNGDPVSVTTIRDTKYYTYPNHPELCQSKNPEYFDTIYLPPYNNPFDAPINYNGVTVPLTAKADVVPNKKYHIKMVISDRIDKDYDSAVFLEGGSFNIGNVDLGSDLTGPNALCVGTTATVVSGLDPSLYTIFWTKDTGNGPVVIPDEHEANLVVSEPGTYAVNAQYGVSSCYATDSIVVEVYHLPGTPKNLVICEGTGAGVFDLTQNISIFLAPYTTPQTVSYFLTQDEANSNQNAIANPSAFQYNGGGVPQTIFVRISNSYCYQTTSFQINVEDLSPQFVLSGATSYCPLGSTTIAVAPKNNDFDPDSVTYSWVFNGVEVGTSSSLLISGAANYGTYMVTVTNSGCSSIQIFDITVEDMSAGAIELASECDGNQYTLVANPVNGSFDSDASGYVWTGPNFMPVENKPNTVVVKTTGIYTVKVITPDGCSSEESTDITNISCDIQKGISPNGDGKNDSLVLNDAKKVEIFNRYGAKVYSFSNYTNQWRGQSDDGSELPDGTYYYVVYRNNNETLTGWIYVLR